MSERGQEIIAALQAGMNARHQREQAEHNKELLKMQIDAHKLAANKMKLDMARQAWEDQTRHSEMQYKMGQQALGVGPVSTVSAPGVGAIPAFGPVPNRPIPFPAPPTAEGVPSGPPSSFTPPTMMQLQLAEQMRKRQDLALAVERARGIAEAEAPYKGPQPPALLPPEQEAQRIRMAAPQPPALLPPDQEAQKLRIAKAGRFVPFSQTDLGQELIKETAHSLAQGDLTKIQTVTSMRNEQRMMVYALAKRENPNFNTADIDRQIKMEDNVTNGKDGLQIQSFGTFLEHAGAVTDALKQIDLTRSALVNKPINWWRSNLSGSPEYVALMTSLEPVRKEFEGFLLGGRALYQDDRAAVEKILSDDASPAMIKSALKTLGHTAKARFNEINHRYKRVRKQDIQDPFPPEAIEGASKIGIDLGGTTKATPTGPSKNPYR